MPNATLIDAGPLIAALNPRDRDHARCVVFLAEFTGTFVTTWPVVTQASHLLSANIDSQLALLKWIERGALDVRHVEVEAVRQMIVYTEKCRDRPMDLADASLVALATQMGLSDIASIDSDFDIYELPNKGRLKNKLAGEPPRGRKRRVQR
jgi:uncharacterized protein